MKAPILDRRGELQGKRGLHALIIGISAYPHLPKENNVNSPEESLSSSATLGMKQLSSSAMAAYKVCQWLIDWQQYLEIPLATCRLLLTPSPLELQVEPSLTGIADRSSLENFREAAYSWREDARSNQDNMTLFYFAGHGVQRVRGDHVMLLEGFGNGKGPLLEDGVTTTNLTDGMAPAGKQKNIARTQLYFMDACRITPDAFSQYEELPTAAIWDKEKGSVDECVRALFYTTAPGRPAYALKGQETFFSKALLACLSGGAGVNDKCVDDRGQPQWCVTVNSLNNSLEYYLKKESEEEGNVITQMFRSEGTGPTVIINRFDKPPEVDVTLRIVPSVALNCTQVKVIDIDGAPVWMSQSSKPHPYSDRLPAGFYRVDAKIDPPTPPYIDTKINQLDVKPPQHNCTIRVCKEAAT